MTFLKIKAALVVELARQGVWSHVDIDALTAVVDDIVLDAMNLAAGVEAENQAYGP